MLERSERVSVTRGELIYRLDTIAFVIEHERVDGLTEEQSDALWFRVWSALELARALPSDSASQLGADE